MDILIFNTSLYWITLIIYYVKKRSLDIGLFIWLLFAISSLASCWYYTFDVVKYSYNNISVSAFLYLYILILICTLPLLNFNLSSYNSLRTKNMKGLLKVISLGFAVAGLIPFIELLLYIRQGGILDNTLGVMYNTDIDKSILFFSKIGRPFFSLIRHFPDIIIILLFYQLTKEKINKYIVLGLVISMITIILFQLLAGSRGGIVGVFFRVAVTVMIFRNMINKKIFATLLKFSIIGVAMTFLAIVIVTISRYTNTAAQVLSKDSGATIDRWVSQYAGEGMIRFNHTIWNLDQTLAGDQNFGYFKSIFGGYDYKSFDNMIDICSRKLNTPVDVFYTFVGDFVIDFGKFGAFFLSLLIMFCLICITRIRNNKIELWQVILIGQFCTLFLYGFAANVYRSYYVQQELIYSWFFVLLFYLFPRININKS